MMGFEWWIMVNNGFLDIWWDMLINCNPMQWNSPSVIELNGGPSPLTCLIKGTTSWSIRYTTFSDKARGFWVWKISLGVWKYLEICKPWSYFAQRWSWSDVISVVWIKLSQIATKSDGYPVDWPAWPHPLSSMQKRYRQSYRQWQVAFPC